MEFLKQWIISIATIVLFITAVEMLLPNNSLKKYAKFVLGLILMTALLNPIIKLFNSDFDINAYSKSVSKEIEDETYKDDMGEYREKNVENTKNTFQKNLDKVILQKIDDQLKHSDFKNNKYEVISKVEYNKEYNNFEIKEIKINVLDKNVSKVKKVKIDLKDKTESSNDCVDPKLVKIIKECLSKELHLDEKTIIVTKIKK